MGLWIVWFIVGIALAVFSMAVLLPRLLKGTYAATLPMRDRALGREEDGSLLFEPTASARTYVRVYRLCRDDEGVYFEGEWGRRAAYVEYELVVFNAANEIVQVLRMKEKFNGGTTTHITRLPANADFVTLRVVRVDDTPIANERRSFSVRFAVLLAAFCVLLAATVDLWLWLVGTLYLRIVDGFTLSAHFPSQSWALLLGLTALVVVAVSASTVLLRYFLLRRRRADES